MKCTDGCYAVLSESGTPSSNMAATKLMDALTRCPGCGGEGVDAVAAYTPVAFDSISHLLDKGNKIVDVWVPIRRNRWPKEAGQH